MNCRQVVVRALAVLIGLAGPNLASAQTPLPGTVQPGQIERQFQKPPEPRAAPGPIQIPATTQQPPANAESIRFVLRQVTLEGVTAYAPDDLRPTYAEHLGREVTLAEIYRIADALSARYRNDGYILSQVVVPAQSVEGGAVRLQAIEGYVAAVRAEGAEALQVRAAAYSNRIKAARPLTASVLERYLLLLNDLPGMTARAVLVPSKTQAGASELVLQLSQRAFAGGLSLDNRGSRALGKNRWHGDLEAYDLLGGPSRSAIRVVTSGNKRLNYLSLAHEHFLGSEGGKLGLSVNVSRSEPETFAIIPLNLETASESLNVTYAYPLVRGRTQNLYLRGTLAAHDGRTELFGVKDTEDRIRAVRLALTWDRADSLGGVNIVDLEFSQGFRGLGSSHNGDPFLSRPDARVDFSKATLYAARLQSLGERWSILAAFSGQRAFTNLLSSELFSYGGEQFGRGHDPSELVGDHGAALKFELRYTASLPFDAGGSYTAYGFYDMGRVRQRNPGGLNAAESAASTGLGLRIGIGRHVSGVVEAAKPVTRIVAQEGNQKTRFFGGLSIRF